ncbi:hypothetical protein [Actinophytocola glycyrrhizae]|uniref:Uncharacterized protein n=1 Tax=Actinophytocola glycyrrhizae TaxID=2044873 RepID=A0ABV9S8J1_9PSEU
MTDQTVVAVPIRWVGALDGAPFAGDGPIPVQRPAAASRAAEWERVLSGWFDPHSGPVPADRVVICWETRALAAATVYGDRCAGELTVCADLDDVLAAIAARPGRAAVVVAFSDRLTVAALVRIDAAAEAAGCPLGFLYGRDTAGLSFAVAKALLRPAVGLSGVDSYDAPAHRAEDNARGLPADVAGGLRRPALVKVIRSHGEGGHAKLGDTVVCGLLDAAEFPGATDEGCSREARSCKRAAPRNATVVFGGEVAAPIVFFLCCNGFNVAGELFPSPVSLAVALAEGSAGAVIAPVRPLVAPDDLVAALHRMIAEGGPLGVVVRRLNELSARLDQPNAFVLHGDPCLTLPTGAAGPAAPPVAEESLDPVRDWLVRLMRHATRGRRVLRSARAWLGGRGADLLDPLAAELDRAEHLAVNAMKWAEGAPGGESRARLLRTTTLLRAAVAKWDRAAGRMLLLVRDSLDAYDLGHYDQLLAGIEPGEPCARCGTPTERHRFGRGEEADQARVGVLCLVCGPVREHRVDGPAVAVTAERAGHRLLLRAGLTVPPSARPLLHGVQLYLRFFDKALDRCVHEEARTVPAEDQVVEFAVELPDRLSADLHSVRLVATTGFDIAYARARFAHLPEGAAR